MRTDRALTRRANIDATSVETIIDGEAIGPAPSALDFSHPTAPPPIPAVSGWSVVVMMPPFDAAGTIDCCT